MPRGDGAMEQDMGSQFGVASVIVRALYWTVRAEPQGDTLNLPVCQYFDPHLMS